MTPNDFLGAETIWRWRASPRSMARELFGFVPDPWQGERFQRLCFGPSNSGQLGDLDQPLAAEVLCPNLFSLISGRPSENPLAPRAPDKPSTFPRIHLLIHPASR